MRQIETRLHRLECFARKSSKRFILVDDGCGTAQAEAAALRKKHGGDIEVILVRTGVPR